MALDLRLLGGLEMADAGGRSVETSAKKARALLAFLAADGRRHAREKVAALLWGDISKDEHARRSLRQALTVLRKVLPDGVLDAGRDDVALVGEGIVVDVRAFRAALASGDADSLRRAVALYRGDFLDGFSARADGFDDWAASERLRLRELALSAMERLGRIEHDAGRIDAAITVAMRAVALEPLREPAHRNLMQLYVAAGAPARALRQYETCRKLLSRELGLEPSAQTSTLAARIRAADVELEEPAKDVSLPRAVSIDVEAKPTLRHVVVVHVEAPRGDGAPQRRGRDAIREALTGGGGRVLRDTLDAVTGVFGAERSRGDLLERALRSALGLRDRLRELGVESRVGIASGQALVEELATGLVAQGEVVSLASSLTEVGTFVVSGAVRAHLGARAEVLERARVRGVAAWELVSLVEGSVTLGALLGRDFELAQLLAMLAPCTATGRGRSVVVRGEPGIGKTSLVSEACREARRSGFEVRRHHVLDFGRGAEVDLLSALTRDLLLDAPHDDPDGALEDAVRRGDLDAHDLGLARAAIRSAGARSAEIDLDPDETARRHEEIVSKLLVARSRRRPQLVWVEDIHWAAPTALRQLASLVSTAATCRALLVMTTRIVGEPDDAEWRRAVKGRAVSTLDLAPLDEPTARVLLDQLALRRGGAAGVDLARVVARANGNPLFLEQLSLADTPDAVPGPVQALVQSRLDALGGSAREVLDAACVLGHRVEEAALAEVVGSREPELTELVEHGLLRVDEDDGISFSHALVREAVYLSLTDARRTALHLAASAHYAAHDALLRAGHLERARHPEAPQAYAAAAADERCRGGMSHALELCERGLGLATRGEDLQGLELMRGELLRELGRSADALRAFDASLRHSRRVEERTRARLGIASVYRVLDRGAQALATLEDADRELDAVAAPELASHVHFMRGNILFPGGDAEACLREHRRALELARAARSPVAEAQALGGVADAHYVASRMRSASALFEQCEALASREGIGALERSSRGMRLVIQLLFLRARECAERCIEEAVRAERVGALRAAAVVRTGGCLALRFLGEWERMAQEAELASALARGIGARRFEALSCAYVATARFHLGQAHEAELSRAVELSSASGLAFSGGIVHAAVLDTTTEPTALRSALRRGLTVLEAGAVSHGRVVFLASAITAAVRLRDAAEARRMAERMAVSCEEPCELPALFTDLGRAAASVLEGDRGAHGALAAVRDRAASSGLLPVAALADELAAPA